MEVMNIGWIVYPASSNLNVQMVQFSSFSSLPRAVKVMTKSRKSWWFDDEVEDDEADFPDLDDANALAPLRLKIMFYYNLTNFKIVKRQVNVKLTYNHSQWL